MRRMMLKPTAHRMTCTQVEWHYEASCAIAAQRASGMIRLNSAAGGPAKSGTGAAFRPKGRQLPHRCW